MVAAELFDIVAREAETISNRHEERVQQMADLADELVASAITDWHRIHDFEERESNEVPESVGPFSSEHALYQLYSNWAIEAGKILARTRRLSDFGRSAKSVAQLEDLFARTQARLKVSPAAIQSALQQVTQGESIPIGELRDELHSTIRARRKI